MPQNVYTSCSPIIVGCFLYTDSGLTTPAPNGVYSDGVDVYTVTGGAGEVTATALCDNFTTTTTSTTTTTTTPPPTTTTTTTTTSTTTTTTTPPPTTTTTTTTTTSTTTTTTTLFQNLFFDATAGIGGYSVTAIDVNGVTPTLTSGTNVPFNTDGHGYNTTQTGTNETLNITVGSYILNGCITVVDSASNSFQQNVTGNGNIAFTGLTINNTTAVVITLADNAC